MTRVVFLDIDGVLNSRRFLYDGRKRERPLGQIDPAAVARLSRIVEATGAKVVVSSTWRILHSRDDIQFYLSHHGFIGEVIGMTGTAGCDRFEQILEWLACGDPTESYVILDDDSDAANADMRPCFIQTDFQHGLLERHVDQAIGILMGSSAQSSAPCGR